MVKGEKRKGGDASEERVKGEERVEGVVRRFIFADVGWSVIASRRRGNPRLPQVLRTFATFGIASVTSFLRNDNEKKEVGQ